MEGMPCNGIPQVVLNDFYSIFEVFLTFRNEFNCCNSTHFQLVFFVPMEFDGYNIHIPIFREAQEKPHMT